MLAAFLAVSVVFAQGQVSPFAGTPSPFAGAPSSDSEEFVHQNVTIAKSEKTLKSQWAGKRVGILGDSMTDVRTLGGPQTTLWWGYLQQLLGLGETYVYGISGHQWHQIYGQAAKLYEEHGSEVDAILIFAGTNDYNAGVPVGTFFTEEQLEVEVKGPKIVTRTHRVPVMADSTVCGRINKSLGYIKEHFPHAQIVVMTPIHRGYAKFNAKNVQPDEFYCNAQGLFLEDYVELYKKGAAYWSVPVADLYGESGILPNLLSNSRYINRSATDRLHPSTEGQYRIAKFMQYRLLSLPANF